jgi:hypothetical protein
MTPEDAFRAGSRPHEVDLLAARIIRGTASPAAGIPYEPGDLPRVCVVGLVQVLLLSDEITNVGGIAMEALALGPGGSVPADVLRRPGRGRRAGIRHGRWCVHWRVPQRLNCVKMPISGHWPGFACQGSLTF